MTISRSQTGKIMSLKLPPHLKHKVKYGSPAMEKQEKKKAFLPATKKNFVKYKEPTFLSSTANAPALAKVKKKKNLSAKDIWKFSPDVKQV